jgi:hypothetical protein
MPGKRDVQGHIWSDRLGPVEGYSLGLRQLQLRHRLAEPRPAKSSPQPQTSAPVHDITDWSTGKAGRRPGTGYEHAAVAGIGDH